MFHLCIVKWENQNIITTILILLIIYWTSKTYPLQKDYKEIISGLVYLKGLRLM